MSAPAVRPLTAAEADQLVAESTAVMRELDGAIEQAIAAMVLGAPVPIYHARVRLLAAYEARGRWLG